MNLFNYQSILLPVLISLILGCDTTTDTSSSDYLNRLQNVLDIQLDPQDTVKPTFALPPNNWSLTVNQNYRVSGTLSNRNLSIREFMATRGCRLHTVLAQRNSQLGRIASNSQQLISDLEVLSAGPACVRWLEQQQQVTLANKLSILLIDKRNNVNDLLSLSVLGSSENLGFWSQTQLTKNYPEQLPIEAIPAINSLLNWAKKIQAGDFSAADIEKSTFEQQLAKLQHGDGGQLLWRLQQIKHDLQIANKVLMIAIDRRICPQAKPNQKIEYLANVVDLVFINGIQQELVSLHRRYQQLMPSYLMLEQLLIDDTPKAYQEWQHQRQQLFEASLNAAKIHVAVLQELFRHCGTSLKAY